MGDEVPLISSRPHLSYSRNKLLPKKPLPTDTRSRCIGWFPDSVSSGRSKGVLFVPERDLVYPSEGFIGAPKLPVSPDHRLRIRIVQTSSCFQSTTRSFVEPTTLGSPTDNASPYWRKRRSPVNYPRTHKHLVYRLTWDLGEFQDGFSCLTLTLPTFISRRNNSLNDLLVPNSPLSSRLPLRGECRIHEVGLSGRTQSETFTVLSFSVKIRRWSWTTRQYCHHSDNGPSLVFTVP